MKGSVILGAVLFSANFASTAFSAPIQSTAKAQPAAAAAAPASAQYAAPAASAQKAPAPVPSKLPAGKTAASAATADNAALSPFEAHRARILSNLDLRVQILEAARDCVGAAVDKKDLSVCYQTEKRSMQKAMKELNKAKQAPVRAKKGAKKAVKTGKKPVAKKSAILSASERSGEEIPETPDEE